MEEIIMDSYECINCYEWSHSPQPVSDDKAPPSYCPYCGEEALEWRTDNNWKLCEVVN